MGFEAFYAGNVPEPTRNRDTRIPPWVIRAIFVFWGVFGLLYVGRTVVDRLQTLFVMLLLSLFLALAIEPAVDALARRGWRRGSATGILLGAITVSSLAFIGVIGALVATQVGNLADRAPEYLGEIERWVNNTFNTEFSFDGLIDQTSADGAPLRDLASNGLKLTTTAAGVLFQLLGVGLFSFYMVADGPKLRRTLCSRLRPELQARVLSGWEVAIDKTGGYIYSRAVLALLSATCHWVAFALIGVPNAVALALWVGIVSQFLPVVGTYLAGVLPLVVTLVDRPVRALWVLGFVLLYQQLENYVFLPRITARTMSLHPAIAFGSAIIGGALLGPVGAVLALPMAASIQAFASMYGTRHEVVDSPLTVAPGSGGVDAADS